MIHIDASREVIAQIEGPAWLVQDDGGQYTTARAKKLREAQYAAILACLEEEYDSTEGVFDESSLRSTVQGGVIYGLGGWNRYFVFVDSGEVQISASHASSGSLEKALALGMRVFR